MSYAKTSSKKARKRLRTEEERRVANLIRKGALPRYFFTKQDVGSTQLQRNAKGRLTWKIESTYIALTNKIVSNDSKS